MVEEVASKKINKYFHVKTLNFVNYRSKHKYVINIPIFIYNQLNNELILV